MATATTTMRWEFIKALFQAVQGLDGLQVSILHPGDTIEKDAMWFGLDELQGVIDVTAMTGGRPEMDDVFTFPVRVRVKAAAGKLDDVLDAAMTRCEQIVGQLQNTCSDDPDLNNLDGLDWCQIKGSYHGPSPDSTQSGVYVFAEVGCWPVKPWKSLTPPASRW